MPVSKHSTDLTSGWGHPSPDGVSSGPVRPAAGAAGERGIGGDAPAAEERLGAVLVAAQRRIAGEQAEMVRAITSLLEATEVEVRRRWALATEEAEGLRRMTRAVRGLPDEDRGRTADREGTGDGAPDQVETLAG